VHQKRADIGYAETRATTPPRHESKADRDRSSGDHVQSR
jgi:hypothetical protein